MSAVTPPALGKHAEARWERIQQGGVWLLDPERDATLIEHLDWSGQVHRLHLVVAARDSAELGPRLRDLLPKIRRMP